MKADFSASPILFLKFYIPDFSASPILFPKFYIPESEFSILGLNFLWRLQIKGVVAIDQTPTKVHNNADADISLISLSELLDNFTGICIFKTNCEQI